MAALDRDLCALAEGEQPARVRRGPVDPYQSFSADLLKTRGAEQDVAAGDAAHLDGLSAFEHALDEGRLDALDTAGVGPEAASADNERERRLVDSEDIRPAAGDDVEQLFDGRRLDCGEHCGVDRGDRVRMAAGEGDEVLIGLDRFAEPLPQARDCPLLESNDLRHRLGCSGGRLISSGQSHSNGLSSVQPILEGKTMLSAALSVLAGSVIAATPVTPLPWFEFEDYPMKAFEKRQEGVTRFELLVTPAGKIADCRITSSSGHEELDKATCHLATKRVQFRPAKGADGQPVWGLYRTQAAWALPENRLEAPPPPDLEVSLNKLPEGAVQPPAVKVAYAVDQQGNPSTCTLMPSSLRQPDVLVELACKELMGRSANTPVIGPGGQPVPAVKTGAVLFKEQG